jgi:1-acyl-sn-glycerol-3-phosphate acyltransferase
VSKTQPTVTVRSYLERGWYWSVRTALWVVFKLAFRLRWCGTEQLPRFGPLILVTNHQSYLDPILVGIPAPRMLRFLARDTLFFWPLRPFIRSLGAVAIDREGGGLSGLKQSLALLKLGEALVVFPEGTRSRDGRLGLLKPGFCSIARRGRATLVPVGIAGAFSAWPRGRRFPHPAPIGLAFGLPLTPDRFEALSDEALLAQIHEQLQMCMERAAELHAS